MGSKNEPGKYDCYANALPDEPMFILLARDPLAPEIVEQWAIRRVNLISEGLKPQSDYALVEEARECADKMRAWREENDGAWRKPSPSKAFFETEEEANEAGDNGRNTGGKSYR